MWQEILFSKSFKLWLDLKNINIRNEVNESMDSYQ